jgi:hypothetical protein
MLTTCARIEEGLRSLADFRQPQHERCQVAEHPAQLLLPLVSNPFKKIPVGLQQVVTCYYLRAMGTNNEKQAIL